MRRWRLALFCLTILLLTATAARAFYLDADGAIELKGKLETRLSLSTEETDGLTSPHADAGELVQERNLAYVEFNHDLRTGSRLGFDLKYHLLGRFLYEGIYDFGPQEYQDVRKANRDAIDDFKLDGDLWEGYVDFSKGAFFTRIGRQKLAWGETDLFRLLDNINPLDNTFGGITEDLDDRRIPIFMTRANYNFGKVGPVSSFALEAFLSPAFIDQKVSPFAPLGTRYNYPFPLPDGTVLPIDEPDETLENSRYGIRQTGVLGDNLNYTLAYMHTIPDVFGAHINLDHPESYFFELVYDPVDIVGGSINYYWGLADAVIRSEVAWFMDEPVFVPEVNLLPDPIAGDIPKKDFLRYMIGFDKQIWMRALNDTQTFFIALQYFGQWADAYDDRMTMAVPITADLSRFPAVKEYEQTVTGAISTKYWHGKLEPQLAVAYDMRGAVFIQPQLNYLIDPFRIKLQYSTIEGNFTGFGVLRDRDQVSLIVTWLF